MTAHRFSRSTAISVAALALAALAISGCGTNILSAPAIVTTAPIQGSVLGGSTPISGASVTLWESDPASTGYPSATNENAKLIQTTTTNASGGFSFNAYTCDAASGTTSLGTATAGPFLYITSSGGDTGVVLSGNSGAGQNNNALLMTALGGCSYLEANRANLHVTVNKATTVAAAAALGGFMYVNEGAQAGPNKVPSVYINAPANNNAATGTCTGSGGTMQCASAGLSHAFANAYNLVDGFDFGSGAGGAARTSIPANPLTGGAANANAIVPQALIHAIANIIQSCINTTGETAPGDGSACDKLFSAAPTTSNGAVLDTLSAAIDIVQNPDNNVTTLFALVPGTPLFVPTLSAAPHDFSIAIAYPANTLTGASGNSAEPQALALDAADNVYIASSSLISSAGTGYLNALTSSGASLWSAAANTTVCDPQTVVTDTLGNVWVASYNTSSTTCNTSNSINEYAQSSGANNFNLPSSSKSVYGLAVDKANNLWYGVKSTSCGGTECVAELVYTSGSTGAAAYGAFNATGGYYTAFGNNSGAGDADTILVDANQNIWAGFYEGNTAGTYPLAVVPNLGTAAAPSYATSTANSAASTNYALGGTTGFEAFGMLAIDQSGNVWTNTAGASSGPWNLTDYSLSGSSGGGFTAPIGTTITTSSTTTGNLASLKPYKAASGEFDGNNQFWFSTSSGANLFYYNATNAANSSLTDANLVTGLLVPCYLPSNAPTTCSATLTISDSHSMQIDSTGAIWVAANAVGYAVVPANGQAQGFVIQVLGAAAPTWPQLNYAKFGVKPQ